ncbi:protein BUNDLE SHEATH DEFECTIVE 2, chloroplastic [Ipomoea triloba]|uniref:protein BUNDLE SHEATH DEFECTIVE 2, chloroplastic n=1 Tax=Ipomoea triloba TaxID=35885 RepID=UPI00125D88AF|nr:protein BUNDLE SHEATH DEFECTIVE 2, chloroplastic [Ipomoea triloba]
MASSLCFTPLTSFNKPITKPGAVTCTHAGRKIDWISDISRGSRVQTIRALEVKATDDNKSTKVNSIVCADCEGNGAILCSQCKGTGVNSVDHFNGQFKAGQLCWLCRGKKDILCGSCNGAGFIGGFMSTFDD